MARGLGTTLVGAGAGAAFVVMVAVDVVPAGPIGFLKNTGGRFSTIGLEVIVFGLSK